MSVRRLLSVGVPLLAAGGAVGLLAARARHEAAASRLWHALEQPPGPGSFDSAMVEGLPEPACRYFLHALGPGTPLARSVTLRMHGGLRLRPDAPPLAMSADQILAPPHGFVWRARVARGPLRMNGFDRHGWGAGELRWWAWGLIPAVHGAGEDVSRSAAGRLGLESVLLPPALLPHRGVEWRAVDAVRAVARIVIDGGEAVEVTIEVAADGRLLRASGPRWREDAGDGAPGYVPFAAEFTSEERSFGGVTIPTRLRAGWRLGEPGVEPFFEATIDDATFR